MSETDPIQNTSTQTSSQVILDGIDWAVSQHEFVLSGPDGKQLRGEFDQERIVICRPSHALSLSNRIKRVIMELTSNVASRKNAPRRSGWRGRNENEIDKIMQIAGTDEQPNISQASGCPEKQPQLVIPAIPRTQVAETTIQTSNTAKFFIIRILADSFSRITNCDLSECVRASV